MKLLAVIACAFLMQSAAPTLAQQQPQKASIQGNVIRVGTGEFIVDAQMILVKISPLSGPAASAPLAGSIPPVATDDQGRFMFTDLEPGSYRLTAVADGYSRQEYGQRIPSGSGQSVQLAADQALSGLTILMTPTGTATGRITNDAGKPAVDADVQLFQISYDANGVRRIQPAGLARTDDRGEYRLFWVTPGRYYVMAGSLSGVIRSVDSSRNSVTHNYAGMYYPGVVSLAEAMPIHVQSGVETSAIDLVVPRQRLYRISGRVVGPMAQQHVPSASITLNSSLYGRGVTRNIVSQSYDSASGTFEIRDIPPGVYVVGARIQDPNAPAGARPTTLPPDDAQAAVTITNSDVDGLVLTILPGVSLPGRLKVEGEEVTGLPDVNRLRVRLDQFIDRLGGISVSRVPSPQQVEGDGTFRLDRVFPGRYRVTVGPLAPDYYLKEVRFDQSDALDKPLQFTGSVPGPIEILISRKSGQITGSVTLDKRQGVPDVQVVLIPDRNRDRVALYKTSTTDRDGRFVMRGIAPGAYKLFAWESIQQYAYFDSDLVTKFEPQGIPVRVEESDKLVIDVKLIPGFAQ
ncbi:MAG: carboxypeptidase regulatory-like domain-containing protein [Acidobacteria bacterium]|nr:carboxypeptidase regulatory-like domain-containing protein [Acidobacteriota bacterium]